MEIIRIYHSLWRMLLLVLASFAFVAACAFMICHPKNGFHVVVALVAAYVH